MANDDNPLLKALPPETDYISYLTILEYNLTHEQLPTLHGILQDQTLTANIGWDLVHLLLPLLPASQQCLQDVSRLGNPREVVLKVTELLEAIGSEEEGEDDEEDQEEKDVQDEEGAKVAKKLEDITREDLEIQDESQGSIHPALRKASKPPQPPSDAVKFVVLLEMLSILHPRIKTKYPSRFLSTSLQAILPAYMRVARHPETTQVILGFIKDLSGSKRPKLPPRKSSSALTTQANPISAPDPEGNDEALGTDEVGLQSRLLQSFLTYVTEGYMTSLVADDDVPGLAWSSRYQEKMHPKKIVPGRRTYTSLFAAEDHLHNRDSIVGHILALSRDLNIKVEELLAIIQKPEVSENDDQDQELPSTASDVPFSRTGSIYLLATVAASSTFFSAPTSLPLLNLLSDLAAILASSLGDSATGSTGAEPEPLIDAVTFLGFHILQNHKAEDRKMNDENDKVYNNILQRLSLLSANTPSPVLRYNAHLLTTSILHAHPSDNSRLAFIKDTLEHCPYENLKASAVGWLKNELLAADTKPPSPPNAPDSGAEPSIFATPGVLSTLEPFLFPNAEKMMEALLTTEAYAVFQAHQSFFLAVLNLLYLLLSSPSLSVRLGVKNNIERLKEFLTALKTTSRWIRSEFEDGEVNQEGEQERREAIGGLDLVDVSVGYVEEVIGRGRSCFV